MTKRIRQAIDQCDEILATSDDCAAEIDLLLGAIARQADWSENDILELHRQLVLHFADELCEQKK